MLNIQLSAAGKRYNREWIFRNLTCSFLPGETYAITGPNGSGKSTLLQVISAGMGISAGECRWQNASNEAIPSEKVHLHLAMAAPYLEVIEEMTALEFLQFHAGFKPFLPGLSSKEILHIIGLEKAAGKQIRHYSSGMKQRLKLAQAIFAQVPLLLLDEPCTNLDLAGYQLYHQLIKEYTTHKTVIVSSNDLQEYHFCRHTIHLPDYKQ
ncbi:ABC transporter ATP-binding protein [Filimonas lacunae]|nr:ABC transporter ATP-binding protein [Filimonas lacunae]